MNNYPIRVENCPIAETDFEIRFNSKLPDDAVFGVIYNLLLPSFSDYKITPLPISQLPADIRNNDPNLKYQPTYNMEKDEMGFGIGPHSIVFTNRKPYKGWNVFKDFISKAFDLISKSDAIFEIERLGLRYINVITPSLFDATNVKIDLGVVDFNKESQTTINTELTQSDGSKVILILNNNVMVTIGNAAPILSSMIDIDVLKNVKFSKSEKDLNAVIDKEISLMHDKEKEIFFSLLSKNFLDELKPIYQ